MPPQRPTAGRIVARATLALTLLASALAAPAAAQSGPAGPGEAQFQTGTLYAGPRIWIGNLNGATAIGAQAERGLTQPAQYGPGIVSAGVGVDYYRWSRSFASIGRYEYSVIPIQAFSNYHFIVDGQRAFDPYVGLALVYSMVSASWNGAGSAGATSEGSGTTIAGQAGLRYFLSPTLAVQGQVGFGYGTLGLGASWRF